MEEEEEEEEGTVLTLLIHCSINSQNCIFEGAWGP